MEVESQTNSSGPAKLLYRVDEACEALRIGRTSFCRIRFSASRLDSDGAGAASSTADAVGMWSS